MSDVEIRHDPVNERIVLATVFCNPEARPLLSSVEPDAFVVTEHGVIWEAMRELQRRQLGFDVRSLHALVSGHQITFAMLRSLQESKVEIENLEMHVSALRWDRARVDSVERLNEIVTALKDPRTKPAALRRLAKRLGEAYDVSVDRSFLKNTQLVVEQQAVEMLQRREHRSYPYGVDALDFKDGDRPRMIPGAKPGQVTLITAVSGSAKSVLAAKIALAQARRFGRRVAYGAWEMGPGATLEMMATMELGLSRERVSTGDLNDEELRLVKQTMAEIGDNIRFFDPPFHNSIERDYDNKDAMSELHRYVVDSGCSVGVFDLLERCMPDGDPESERRALFAFQQIAIETNTHLIAVCQQRLKEIETRVDKRPTRATILGSSAWVDIGDTILGIHRPGLWMSLPKDQETVEVIVLKQRYGVWPQTVKFSWDGDKMDMRYGEQVRTDRSDTRREHTKEQRGKKSSLDSEYLAKHGKVGGMFDGE